MSRIRSGDLVKFTEGPRAYPAYSPVKDIGEKGDIFLRISEDDNGIVVDVYRETDLLEIMVGNAILLVPTIDVEVLNV